MDNTKKRERSVAHLWADKRVLRFFRKTTDKKIFKNLMLVYIALCHIDSDFTQNRDTKKKIYNITKTCATYSGLNKNTVSMYLQLLKSIELIDYGAQKDPKTQRYTSSYLTMYEFNEEKILNNAVKLITNDEKTVFLFSGTRFSGTPTFRNTDFPESIKNNILYILYIIKNPSKEGLDYIESLLKKTYNVSGETCSFLQNNFSDNLDNTGLPNPENLTQHLEKQPEVQIVDKNKQGLVKQNSMPINKTKKAQASCQKLSIVTKRILDFWKALSLPKHNETSKTVFKAEDIIKKLIAGTFFQNNPEFKQFEKRKFTEAEIQESIKNFALAATNFDYQPTDANYKNHLKKINIDAFFYNPRSKKIKSMFVHYLTKPELVDKKDRFVDDSDPVTTEIIKEFWINKILNGIKPSKFSYGDENNFRKATNQLTEWFKLHGKKIVPAHSASGDNPIAKRKRVKLLFDSLLDCVGEQSGRLTTGWLCSVQTFSDRFPRYLNEMGVTY